MQKADSYLAVFGWAAAAIGTALNPWASIGAFGGCCFFLAMPSYTKNTAQRLLLLLFSWVMGYGCGAWVYPGPPWSQEAMLVSGVAAALSSVVFTALYHAIHAGADLPPWMRTLIRLLRGRD